MALSSLSKSLMSRMSVSVVGPITSGEPPPMKPESYEGDSSFSHMMNRDLYPQRKKIVEDGCGEDLEPFQLLSGENIEYIGNTQEDFIIAISNYRLFATQADGFYSVPLGLIEIVEQQSNKDVLHILCKDARTFRLLFSSSSKSRLWQERVLEAVRRPAKNLKNAFAFIHRAYHKDLKLEKPLPLPAAASDSEDLDGSDDVLSPTLLSLKTDLAAWRDEVMTNEYRRMGVVSSTQSDMGNRVWRISQLNDRYKLCGTYPKLLVVPSSISDEDLAEATKFRMLGRLPIVVWRHPTNGSVIVRSSQPQVGVLGWRSPDDERLLLAISKACSMDGELQFHHHHLSPRRPPAHLMNHIRMNGIANGGTSIQDRMDSHSDSEEEEEGDGGEPVTLMVFDLRSYTAALGNRAKGGGCECTDYYPNCEIEYKSLPNIHSVRKSFHHLRAVLNSDDQANYLSNLENTQWMFYLSQLLSVASEVVGVVNDRALPVLVHCSDGWDRTPQIVALAELMLDPHYRTIKGFKVLVEREWIGYGHKFGDRCGHTSEDLNQRSPIFLQWLDCVHQLLKHFPCSFEFNVNYLVKLGQHCYSCLYGTFLCNSMRERGEERVTEDTTPAWSLLHDANSDFINYLYVKNTEVLRPVCHIQNIVLWKEMYSTTALNPYPPVENGWSLSRTTTPPLPPIEYAESASSLNSPISLHPNGPMLNNSGGQDEHQNIEREEYVLNEKTVTVTPDLLSTTKESVIAMTTETAAVAGSEEEGDMSKIACEHEVVFHSCNSSNSNSPNSHESLHVVARRESLHTNNSDSGGLYSKKDEAFCGGDGDSFKATTMATDMTPTTNVIQPTPSSVIEMQPVTSSNQPTKPRDVVAITESLSPPKSNKQAAPLNSSLLQDAITDLSPHAAAALLGHSDANEAVRGNRGKKGNSSLVLGVDGIPCQLESVHLRLRELTFQHQREVKELKRTLRDLQVAAAAAVTTAGTKVEGDGVDIVRGGEGEGLLSNGDMPSPDDKHSTSSLNSWDCVNHEDGQGVRWIPDHAATNCESCGAQFWAALRKHHCRSCGGIFCGQCTNYFCPVPHEQLLNDVRVCEKCYYKLDGHLKQTHTQPLQAPT